MHRPSVLPIAVGFLFLIWLAMLLLGAGAVDRTVLMALYAAERPGVALAAHGFTYLGYAYALIPITAVAAIWLFATDRMREAWLLLVATLSGRLLIFFEKMWFARLRPDENLRLVEVNSLSFPSAHAGNSMVVFLAIALLGFEGAARRRAVVAALALTALIGLSRPMLGVHWPSDVIGGWAFGAGWVLAFHAWWRGRERSPVVQAPNLL